MANTRKKYEVKLSHLSVSLQLHAVKIYSFFPMYMQFVIHFIVNAAIKTAFSMRRTLNGGGRYWWRERKYVNYGIYVIGAKNVTLYFLNVYIYSKLLQCIVNIIFTFCFRKIFSKGPYNSSAAALAECDILIIIISCTLF